MTQHNDERRQGLAEALEKCSESVAKTMLSLLAIGLFCILTALGADDRALVTPEPSIKLPFADVPISFAGFVVVAPLLLVALTAHLHILFAHWWTLEENRQAQGLVQTYPTLFGLNTRAASLLTALVFYWFVPVVFGTIAYKAAARVEWWLPIAFVAGLAMLVLGTVQRKASCGSRPHWASGSALMIMGLLVVGGTVTISALVVHEPLRRASWQRPLSLLRVDLKNAWLPRARLSGADLRHANLSGANLERADLRNADLRWANLSGANLIRANLHRAKLNIADLRNVTFYDTDLADARLDGVNIQDTDLRSVLGLQCRRMVGVSVNERTLLPNYLRC